MEEKKSDPSARAQRTRAKLSLLVTNCFEWNLGLIEVLIQSNWVLYRMYQLLY
jgi:hypothetical protein